MEVATLGSGCFWCVEAVFQELKGVEKVSPGYSGGHIKNPSYKEVCNGTTGHAEVIQIEYDDEVLDFKELLEVFFRTHDPTSLNRQGGDVGTQYRSAIFYHNENQKNVAQEVIKSLDESGAFAKKIVTELSAYDKFYEAEDYHKNYYRNNPEQGYCQMVVGPKLEKFRQVFKEKLK